MLRLCFVFLFSLATFELASADDAAKACLTSAFDAHNQETLKLLKTSGPALSPEAQVMRRRLDEGYCFEVVACTLQDQTGDGVAMLSSAVFSSCLKAQAE